MNTHTHDIPIARILASGLLVLIGCSDTPKTDIITDATAPEVETMRTIEHLSKPFRVVSRNLYLGADTRPLFAADFNNPLSVVTASATVWTQVLQSNAGERMSAIADEIQREGPPMVGLQEAFQFVHLAVRRDGSASPAGFVIDLLAELECALRARGLNYLTVAIQHNTSATLPVAADLSTGAPVLTEAVNFTDRIAVLVRADVAIDGIAQGNYATTFQLAPGFVLKRGWIRVDTRHAGIDLHFTNTHLERQSLAPIQAGQAAELKNQVLADLDGVTILVGDLNSDADGVTGDPSWTPTYRDLISAGFVDAWAQGGASKDPGFTCCQDSDLRNGSSALDERIDFILIRTPQTQEARGRIPGDVRAEVLGRNPGDRTSPNKLWPSDHSGLLVDLRLPTGPFRAK